MLGSENCIEIQGWIISFFCFTPFGPGPKYAFVNSKLAYRVIVAFVLKYLWSVRKHFKERICSAQMKTICRELKQTYSIRSIGINTLKELKVFLKLTSCCWNSTSDFWNKSECVYSQLKQNCFRIWLARGSLHHNYYRLLRIWLAIRSPHDNYNKIVRIWLAIGVSIIL